MIFFFKRKALNLAHKLRKFVICHYDVLFLPYLIFFYILFKMARISYVINFVNIGLSKNGLLNLKKSIFGHYDVLF